MQTTLKQIEPSPTLSLVDETSVSRVPRQDVVALWPVVYPMLAPAIKRTRGRLDEATVFRTLVAGELVLWLICRNGPIGAGVTQVFNWPSGLRAARILVAGGRDHTTWFDKLGALEQWARDQGCTVLEAWGRPGWEKALTKANGWRKTGIEMEKDID